MAIKGILFDKDGTLIAFNNVWGPLYKSMLVNHFDYDEQGALALLQSTGFEPETGTCRGGSPMAVGTLEQIMEVWWPDLSPAVREERRQFVNENADKNAKNFVEPLLELAPVFDALHAAGYILGVGTNDSEGSAKRHMEVLDVHHYFDVVLGSDSVDVPKPSGQMVRRFAGLEAEPETRNLVAAMVAAEQAQALQREGVEDFHFYTLNRADLVYPICRMLGFGAGVQDAAA